MDAKARQHNAVPRYEHRHDLSGRDIRVEFEIGPAARCKAAAGFGTNRGSSGNDCTSLPHGHSQTRIKRCAPGPDIKLNAISTTENDITAVAATILSRWQLMIRACPIGLFI